MKQSAYAAFLKYIREERRLSQALVAEKALMSRASYVAVEKGTKELTLAEAAAITKLFGITLDELLQAKVPDLHIYREMILGFLRAAANTGHTLKKTKLAHLLYLADYSWFFLHDSSLSNVIYAKAEFGPLSSSYFQLLEELEQGGHHQC